MRKPEPSEHPPYYTYYINLIQSSNGLKVLENQLMELHQLIGTVPLELEEYRYAEDKWTIKEVLGHICDVERIFGYRALCIARCDQNALPGFDENAYVQNAQFNQRSLYDLLHEFSLNREANIALFKSYDESVLDRVGTANNNRMSVRAIMFMIAGHEKHHVNTIKERYLKGNIF